MLKVFVVCVATLIVGCSTSSHPPSFRPFLPPVQGGFGGGMVHTFSIVAFDPATEELGVAVESKFFGVGTVVPWAKAKVGAIATQSAANVRYGEDGLDLLRAGNSAEQTLGKLTDEDSKRDSRQAGIVDSKGRCASFTGKKCNGWAGHFVGTNFCVQGNLLAGPQVIEAMAAAFDKARSDGTGELADWMMTALQAGQAAGGDKRGQQSAAILVVREKAGYASMNDRYIDLRVDDHSEPIKELARLLEIHKSFYRSAHQKRAKQTAP